MEADIPRLYFSKYNVLPYGQRGSRILPRHRDGAATYGVLIISAIHRHGYIIAMIAGPRIYPDGVSYRGLLKMESTIIYKWHRMHSYKCKNNVKQKLWFILLTCHWTKWIQIGNMLHNIAKWMFFFSQFLSIWIFYAFK